MQVANVHFLGSEHGEAEVPVELFTYSSCFVVLDKTLVVSRNHCLMQRIQHTRVTPGAALGKSAGKGLSATAVGVFAQFGEERANPGNVEFVYAALRLISADLEQPRHVRMRLVGRIPPAGGSHSIIVVVGAIEEQVDVDGLFTGPKHIVHRRLAKIVGALPFGKAPGVGFRHDIGQAEYAHRYLSCRSLVRASSRTPWTTNGSSSAGFVRTELWPFALPSMTMTLTRSPGRKIAQKPYVLGPYSGTVTVAHITSKPFWMSLS
ncbi:hypothetical protein D3C72_1590260 [compost metagenome]